MAFTYLILFCYVLERSRDSSIGIPTGYELNSRGSIPGADKIFPFSTVSRPVLGTPSLQSRGYRGLFPQSKEADHSPPSRAKVKNDGSVPPLHLYVSSWHSTQLIMHRNNFTLLLWSEYSDIYFCYGINMFV
jgi:hypothetical protein